MINSDLTDDRGSGRYEINFAHLGIKIVLKGLGRNMV